MTAELWAVRVEGPDAIYPMPDKATATEVAERINAEARARDRNSQPVLLWNARVVGWNYGPNLHAEGVAGFNGHGRVQSFHALMNSRPF